MASGWFGTDVAALKRLVLDETGCMDGLALYIVNPGDGGPNVREGRYDATCGFVDSTTGRRIQIDAWSIPQLPSRT